MNPEIVFLGTGGDAVVVGRQNLGSGGIVVRTEDNLFIIDPGPGTTARAPQHQVNLREVTAVLVSHGHLAHSNDVNAVLAAMSHNGLDVKGVLIASESVVQGHEGIAPILTPFHKNCVEKVIIARRDQRIGIETTEIQMLPTAHNDLTGVGFKLFTPNFVLVYTGDTGYDKEFVEQYKNADIMILNVPYPGKSGTDHGLCTDDAIKILKVAKPSLAILTHFGNKMLSADVLIEARRVQAESGVQVIAAKDGMKVNPDSYSSKLKTRTLNLFKK